MIASHRTSLNQCLIVSAVSQRARTFTDMRVLITFVIISVIWVVVCSSPIDSKRRLIIRPQDHEVFERSSQVKGGYPGVKGYNPPMPSLRKGEYICGNKVCKLKPGEIPPGCNGVCQYRIS